MITKYILLISTLLIVFSCKNNRQDTGSNEQLYIADKEDYYKNQVETQQLKNRYEMYYTTNDSCKNVYLKKDSVIRHLNSLPLNVGSFYHLGIVVSDNDSSFLFGHDNGNGSPYTYELIDKSSGKNILAHQVTGIEGNYSSEYFVYYDDSIQELKQKFVLYNVRTRQQSYFTLPAEAFDKNNIFNFRNITVDTLTPKEIVISYQKDTGALLKKYPR